MKKILLFISALISSAFVAQKTPPVHAQEVLEGRISQRDVIYDKMKCAYYHDLNMCIQQGNYQQVLQLIHQMSMKYRTYEDKRALEYVKKSTELLQLRMEETKHVLSLIDDAIYDTWWLDKVQNAQYHELKELMLIFLEKCDMQSAGDIFYFINRLRDTGRYSGYHDSKVLKAAQDHVAAIVHQRRSYYFYQP